MFWRVFARELQASRPRLTLALLVVTSGAAVVSALVNLQYDMDGKLARTFRSFGANVLVTPAASSSGGPALMPGPVWQALAGHRDRRIIAAAPYLYVVAHIPSPSADVIVAGTVFDRIRPMNSWWKLEGRWPAAPFDALVGTNVAGKLHLKPGGSLTVEYGGRSQPLVATGLVTAGGPEDNQIFAGLAQAQQLAGLPGRLSLIQLSVAGSPAQIRAVMGGLSRALPGVDVQPIPEFTAAEAELAGKIRLLVGATVGLILTLTVLGVLAAMAALAVERRGDVGVMKAIGGPTSRIVRLFLAEVGVLALAGALAGCAVGLPLSDWISWRVFGSAATAQWDVVPLVAALMFGAALAGALPLRLLGRVRPAAILRGDG